METIHAQATVSIQIDVDAERLARLAAYRPGVRGIQVMNQAKTALEREIEARKAEGKRVAMKIAGRTKWMHDLWIGLNKKNVQTTEIPELDNEIIETEGKPWIWKNSHGDIQRGVVFIGDKEQVSKQD